MLLIGDFYRQIIFSGPLGSLSSFLAFFFFFKKNRDPLKPVLGGVAGVAQFIIGHGQTQ